MVKLQTLICSTIIILGTADLLTTIMGITGKTASEANPIFSTLTHSNMLAFIGLKILATSIISILFISAAKITNNPNVCLRNKLFVSSASITSNLITAIVVINNILVIFRTP